MCMTPKSVLIASAQDTAKAGHPMHVASLLISVGDMLLSYSADYIFWLQHIEKLQRWKKILI